MESHPWILQHIKYDELNRIIDKTEISIGRSRNVDFISKNPNVSRQHASFMLLEDETLYVKDNNSANGIYVNRISIHPNEAVQIYENDEVGLGLHSQLDPAILYNEDSNTVKKAPLIFIVKHTNSIGVRNTSNPDVSVATTSAVTHLDHEVIVSNANVVSINTPQNGGLAESSSTNLKLLTPPLDSKSVITDESHKHNQNMSTDVDHREKVFKTDDCIIISDDEDECLRSTPVVNGNCTNVVIKTEKCSNMEKKTDDCKTISKISDLPPPLHPEFNKPLTADALLRILDATQFEEEITENKNNEQVEMECDNLITNIKEEPIKTNIGNYTMDDGFFVISDDEEENVHYTQLMGDDQTDNGNEVNFSESIFQALKVELEELDRVPEGTVIGRVCIDDDDDDDDSNDLFPQNQVDENYINNNKVNGVNEIAQNQSSKNNITSSDDGNWFDVNQINNNNNQIEQNPSMLNNVTDADDGNWFDEDHVADNSKKANNINKTEPIKNIINNNPQLNIMHGKNKNNGIIKNHTATKRKQVEKENLQTKKIKTSSFYKKSKSPQPESSCISASDIRNIRRLKLKEIAKKSSEQSTSNQNRAQPKEKVSDSRETLLTEIPSTSKNVTSITSVRMDKVSTDVYLGKTVPKRRIQIIPPHTETKKAARKCKSIAPTQVKSATDTLAKQSSHLAQNPVQQNGSAQHDSASNNHRSRSKFQDIEEIIIQMLYWNPKWFPEYKENVAWGMPPEITGDKLRVMKKTFSSYKDYYDTVIPQMMIELWYFLYMEIDSPVDSRQKKLFAVLTEEQKLNKRYIQLNYYTFINKEQNDDHLHVKEDDVLVVQYQEYSDSNMSRIVLGYVTKVTKILLQENHYINQQFVDYIQISPHAVINFEVIVKPHRGNAITGKYNKLRIITSLVSTLRVFKSVISLKDSVLRKHILAPTLELYKIPSTAGQSLLSKENLNKSQMEAVLNATHICLRNSPGIYLIQGPPGTGKTTVILNIILQILLQTDSSNQRCILVVAPSNGAVDELALRIIDLKTKLKEKKRKLKLVRLGPRNVIHPKVQDYLLYEIAKRNLNNEIMQSVSQSNRELIESKQKRINELYAIANHKDAADIVKIKLNSAKQDYDRVCRRVMGRTYNEKLRKFEEQLLIGAEIICTTLSSCLGLRMEEIFGRNLKQISCCIVDEATQSNEQETLIPLKLRTNKLILVGDPKQLPAVTKAKEAKDFGYGESLFSRIMSNFPKNGNNPVHLLNVQYRMDPEISQFPNRTFYNGQLIDADCLITRRRNFHSLQPYLVFNFDMEMIMNSQEYSNKAETLCVLKLLNVINNKFKRIKNFTVGIITPYNNQKASILTELKTKKLTMNVTVNTVDSFQGQEKDLIIMSCVRENTNMFLSDEQRLNVALTRAKYALFIVGSSNLFRTCPLFGAIRDDATRRKLFIKVNSRTNEQQLSKFILKRS